MAGFFILCDFGLKNNVFYLQVSFNGQGILSNKDIDGFANFIRKLQNLV